MTPNLPTIVEKLSEAQRRCERATGADRRLDLAIAKVRPKHPVPDHASYDHSLDGGKNAWSGGFGMGVPAYTASLDDALTLKPDNCGYVLHQPLGKKPSVALQIGFEGYSGPTTADGWTDYSLGATPALALCAAALKVRTFLQSQGDE